MLFEVLNEVNSVHELHFDSVPKCTKIAAAVKFKSGQNPSNIRSGPRGQCKVFNRAPYASLKDSISVCKDIITCVIPSASRHLLPHFWPCARGPLGRRLPVIYPAPRCAVTRLGVGSVASNLICSNATFARAARVRLGRESHESDQRAAPRTAQIIGMIRGVQTSLSCTTAAMLQAPCAVGTCVPAPVLALS